MTPDESNLMLWVLLIAASVCVRVATRSTAAAFAVFFGLYFMAKVLT